MRLRSNGGPGVAVEGPATATSGRHAMLAISTVILKAWFIKIDLFHDKINILFK
jgi:hypothetical protein